MCRIYFFIFCDLFIIYLNVVNSRYVSGYIEVN